MAAEGEADWGWVCGCRLVAWAWPCGAATEIRGLAMPGRRAAEKLDMI